jgi:hypothetical protein
VAVKFHFSKEIFAREAETASLPVRTQACWHACAWDRYIAVLLRMRVRAGGVASATRALQAISSVTPPLFKIEDSPEALSTDTFPAPLNMAPLPPLIVTEKGESLDEFCVRHHPDFITAVQARAIQLAPAFLSTQRCA